MPRGGKRTPATPAPVSGPGALSARTDGGPGSASQPIRVPTGGAYGEAKALTEQQQAAPLAVAEGSSGGGDVGDVARSQPPPPPDGIFGPTTRPGESPLTGAGQRGMSVAEDLDTFLNVLYSKFPHPAIAQLIEKR